MRIGTIESLWRYPVKSMRGEECPALFAGFAGVYGDRLYAVRQEGAPKVFPYLTARNRSDMVLFTPRFPQGEETLAPPDLSAFEKLAIGVTPLYPTADELALAVTTPAGETMSVEAPGLLDALGEGLGAEARLSLVRSDRALTDCRPISLISLQTVAKLGEEMGRVIDKRRFRMNFYVALDDAGGAFAEDRLLGRRLKIGERAVVVLTERDARCGMIALDPDTAEKDTAISRHVVQAHESCAGVYGAVLAEGMIRAGDEVALLD